MQTRFLSPLVVLVMKTSQNIQYMCQKTVLKKNILIYCCFKKKTEGTMLLLKSLIHSYMIIHYTVEENIFNIIVYKVLAQRKCENVISMIGLKLMVNKKLSCLKRWIQRIC